MNRKKNSSNNQRRPVYNKPTEVFSYHAQRSADSHIRRSPGQAAERSSTELSWLRWLPSILSAIVIICSLFYATSLSTHPRLQISSGTDRPLLREAKYYENAASSILKRSALNYNKLTVNTTKLSQDLRTQYPELGNVAVIIPLSGRRPVIEVMPAVPILKLSGNGGIFIVDEQGRALLSTDEAEYTFDMNIPLVSDQSGVVIEKGKQVLPLNTLNFIREMILQLQSKGAKIDSITLPAIPHEVHVRMQGQGYYIKFNNQNPAREQAGTYLAAQDKLLAEGSVPSEYMDVRVPEKVFYR